jgi:hypothetical protein
VWRSLAARFVRDEEAAGSNPATPTEKHQARTSVLGRTLVLIPFSGLSGEILEKILDWILIPPPGLPLLAGLQQRVQGGHADPAAKVGHQPES